MFAFGAECCALSSLGHSQSSPDPLPAGLTVNEGLFTQPKEHMKTVTGLLCASIALMTLSACVKTAGTPTLTPPDGSGPAGHDVRVLIKTSTVGASLRWTDTSPPPPQSQWTVIPESEGYVITVFGRTLRAMAFKTGLTDSGVATGTYTVSDASPTPIP